MNPKYLLPLIIVAVLAYMSMFTVDQRQLAIVFRLGEIQRSDYKPGLHFMIPFINKVRKFDARLLNIDAAPERFLTSEKKDVIVDSYVKWRIANVVEYYKATGGDQRRAGLLLFQKINDSLRAEFGKRTVQEVVAGERGDVMKVVTKEANAYGHQLGIDVVDVRTKRIDLPAEVSNSVYQRMRAERERVAREFRSRGAEAAERIRASADRERTVLLADANRDAERVRGEGDSQATAIYAKAYDQDPEFYRFYRSLNAYRKSLGSGNDVLVLQPDSSFFKFFNTPDPNAKHSPPPQ